METQIRRAGVEDADAIALVQVESWRTTYRGIVPDAFLASLSAEVRAAKWKEQFAAGNSWIFVAEGKAGIIGFASGGRLRDAMAGYDGELYAIYLLREHQGNGVGRRLILALTEALRNGGFGSMVVWVLERNPAVRFYRAMGGAEIGRKAIEIGGAELWELALGWPDVAMCGRAARG
jgi:GNAT superfamily N-acetyltransferase